VAQSNKGTEKKKIVSSDGTVEVGNDSIQPLFSKTQIEEKLKHLAKTPPPTELAFGAMCYSSSYCIGTISYICPICGGKTNYSDKEKRTRKHNEETFYDVCKRINACRREIQKVKGINISLNESEFCKHCSPYTTNPTLYLLVNISGESKTIKIPDVSWTDIRLIQEFLSGSLVHKGYRNDEFLLVNYIERIKELLGIKEE
jgi:hypothetical protein